MKTFVLRFLMYLVVCAVLTAIIFWHNTNYRPEILRHLTPENLPDFAPVVTGVVAGCAFVLAAVHGLLDRRDTKSR